MAGGGAGEGVVRMSLARASILSLVSAGRLLARRFRSERASVLPAAYRGVAMSNKIHDAIMQIPGASDGRRAILKWTVVVLVTLGVHGIVSASATPLIALHATPATPDSACGTFDVGETFCCAYRTEWPVGEPAYVFLIVAFADPDSGVAGLSLGVDYGVEVGQGLNLLDWTLCADGETRFAGAHGEWPAPGSGIKVTWNAETDCQRANPIWGNVHTVAGYWSAYADGPDRLRLTGNAAASQSLPVVTDCLGRDSAASGEYDVFAVGFGVPSGSACLCTSVRRSTWGSIKRQYSGGSR
jgi:hypothetical protein